MTTPGMASGPRPHAPAPYEPTPLSAEQFLTAARGLLTDVIAGTRGAWPRACAWLIRLALESELTRFWHSVSPPIAACKSRRAQFLLLPRYLDPDLAGRAHQTWAALSRAGHHHAYELGLTVTELTFLLDDATEIVAALRAHSRLSTPEGEPSKSG